MSRVITPYSPVFRRNVITLLACRNKSFVEVCNYGKYPLVLDPCQVYLKLFLRHIQVQSDKKGVDCLRAKKQERYVILMIEIWM